MKLSEKNLRNLLAGKPTEPSEAEFQRQVIEYAQMHGWRVAHFRKVRVQRKNGEVYYETPVAADGKGFPDTILVHEQLCQCLVAELKVGNNQPTFEQREWLSAFRAAGVPTYVWRPCDWAEIETVLGK